jgi:uncharacterized membrane protein YebE (DUF533 family)
MAKSKDSGIWGWVTGLALLAGLSFLGYKAYQSYKKKKANAVGTQAQTGAADTMIRLGSTGDDVQKLQHMLNVKYQAGLTTDGHFGKLTEAALKKALGVTEISTSKI